MEQLRQEVYSIVPASGKRWKALLWDYWMDEAAADTYGVLNTEQAFGFAARKVGAMIATASVKALGGHLVQDVETWDDDDENSAVKIAGRLLNDFPGNG